MDDKCLGDLKFKKKDKAKTFAVMRKSINVDGKETRLSSENLSQRLLATVRDKDLLQDVFSHELSAVAPSLFHDNGDMRKNNKADLMNELLVPGMVNAIQIQGCYYVFDGCAWLYTIPWPKVGNFHDLYKLFFASIKKEREAGSGITVIFDNYNVESTKAPEQKRRKRGNLISKVDVKLNTLIPTDREKLMLC